MLSVPHMIVVFVIVLVVFGPQKLPELARGLGKLMAEFRKASTDFRSAFEEELRDLERQAREVERRKAEAASAAAATSLQGQPAALASPSGAETQVGAREAGAGEGPVVAPVAEGNVARETEAGVCSAAPTAGDGSAAPETHELEAKAQKADT
jgi:TatA/E family protein of Tat protein translocase